MIINYEFVLRIVWDLVWKAIGLSIESNSSLAASSTADRRTDAARFLSADDRSVESIVCFTNRLPIEIVSYKVICKRNNLLENDIYRIPMINKNLLCIRSYM